MDDDGSILWGTTDWFGYSAHIDGAVVDDIDPSSPGFEVLLFSETGPEWGVYAEAHPGASSDLELVQSLWIQEVPKK